eukprot:8733865-Lingulodinium_polyedra.AAC.1
MEVLALLPGLSDGLHDRGVPLDLPSHVVEELRREHRLPRLAVRAGENVRLLHEAGPVLALAFAPGLAATALLKVGILDELRLPGRHFERRDVRKVEPV